MIRITIFHSVSDSYFGRQKNSWLAKTSLWIFQTMSDVPLKNYGIHRSYDNHRKNGPIKSSNKAAKISTNKNVKIPK